MKNFKRIQAMFLAVIMAVMTFGTNTAFAAENVPADNNVIQASDVDYQGDIVSTSEDSTPILRDSIFYISKDDGLVVNGGARGKDFGVHVNKIKFQVAFYDYTNGKKSQIAAGSVILAVRLYDNTAGNVLVQEWQSSTGGVGQTVDVTADHTYHFEYLIAYGSKPLLVYNTIKRA